MLLLRFIRGGLTRLPEDRSCGRAQVQRRSPNAAATIGNDDCGYDGHATRRTLLAAVGLQQRILASFLFWGDLTVNMNQKYPSCKELLLVIRASRVIATRTEIGSLREKEEEWLFRASQQVERDCCCWPNVRPIVYIQRWQEILKYVTLVFKRVTSRWFHRAYFVSFLISWRSSDNYRGMMAKW